HRKILHRHEAKNLHRPHTHPRSRRHDLRRAHTRPRCHGRPHHRQLHPRLPCPRQNRPLLHPRHERGRKTLRHHRHRPPRPPPRRRHPRRSPRPSWRNRHGGNLRPHRHITRCRFFHSGDPR